MIKNIVLYFTLFLITNQVAFAEDVFSPDEVFIDKGACPFEGCRYGKWVVLASESYDSVDVYDEIDGKNIVGSAKVDDIVEAITGGVHTIPGVLEVLQSYDIYKPGDKIYVLSYIGEGVFKVRFNGEIFAARYIDEFFMPGGRSKETLNTGWAKIIKNPQSVWWVNVKLKDGTIGWLRPGEYRFGNMDAFGVDSRHTYEILYGKEFCVIRKDLCLD